MHPRFVRQCVLLLLLLLILFCNVLIGSDDVYADIIISDNFSLSNGLSNGISNGDDSWENPEGGPKILAVTNQDEPIEIIGFLSNSGNHARIVNNRESDNSFDDGKDLFTDDDSIFLKLNNEAYHYDATAYILTNRNISETIHEIDYVSPAPDYVYNKMSITDKANNGSPIPGPDTWLVFGIMGSLLLYQRRRHSP